MTQIRTPSGFSSLVYRSGNAVHSLSEKVPAARPVGTTRVLKIPILSLDKSSCWEIIAHLRHEIHWTLKSIACSKCKRPQCCLLRVPGDLECLKTKCSFSFLSGSLESNSHVCMLPARECRSLYFKVLFFFSQFLQIKWSEWMNKVTKQKRGALTAPKMWEEIPYREQHLWFNLHKNPNK